MSDDMHPLFREILKAHLTPEGRLARVDEIKKAIEMGLEGKTWEPSSDHPVTRKHEIKKHNQRLDNMASHIRLAGGEVKNYERYEDELQD